ncbi:MAG TPA: hypothetical protein DCY30_08955 [Acidimicrobiaceae bacterium]|nr:hypothetical protein [Acidimicrobiaceae bacterium]
MHACCSLCRTKLQYPPCATLQRTDG